MTGDNMIWIGSRKGGGRLHDSTFAEWLHVFASYSHVLTTFVAAERILELPGSLSGCESLHRQARRSKPMTSLPFLLLFPLLSVIGTFSAAVLPRGGVLSAVRDRSVFDVHTWVFR